ncbi:MAG: lysoplasmalogenase [Rhodocyclaceae bacterium]|nr:lysoplasmalogenase [Rhodocyclaceae bacterium]
MRSAQLALIAALSTALFLVGLALDISWLRLAAKPWPVLAMAAWVWPKGDRRIAWGLIFGAIGDICLAIPGAFVAGMLAFAIGHGLYAKAFYSWQRSLSVSLLFPVLIYFAVTVPITLSASGELVIPVAVYMSIIGLMIWRAAVIAVDESVSGIKRWAALIGAVLFAFSDTLIGINKFVTPLPGCSYAIILLYWGGQALIAAAAVARTSQSFTPNT